jgi:DNA-binding SARP family transcriptional activator
MDGAPAPRVGLLDGFTLRLGRKGPGSPVEEIPQGLQRLVAHLGLCTRRARPAIAGQLWPDVPERQAQGSLRSALWRVHKLAPGLVTAAGGTLSLASDVRVDVQEFRAWARSAIDPCSRIEEIAPSEGSRGELLPGWYDDWVLLERERLRQLRMHAFEALAEKLAAAGRFAEAVEAAYAAVQAEPLRESAHRTLVRVHLAEGNTTEAVHAFESFRTLLADELRVAPTRAMLRLIRDLPSRAADGAGKTTTMDRGSSPAFRCSDATSSGKPWTCPRTGPWCA